MSAHAVGPPISVDATDADDADDPALVSAAQRGDASAREGLFRKYGMMVSGLCFRLLGRDEDLDDLVQECFMQMFRSLDRLDNPQAFRAWMCQVVVRTTRNLIRRRRLMVRIGLRPHHPVNIDGLISPAAPPDVAYTLTLIYRILERLPARVRVALILRRVDGQPLGEVARLMGVSIASVKRWLVAADRELATERGDHRRGTR